MDGVLRKELEFIEGVFVGEGAVSIETEFDFVEREPIPDSFDEVEFLVEVDGTDLKLDAAEASLQFLLHTLKHFLVIAHPDEAVDGDADLATRKSGVEEAVAMLEIQQSRLQAEKHRGVVAEVGGNR
jgi:hypothetical protein